MSPEYRKQLLALKSKIAGLIAETEALTVATVTDDEVLLRATKALAELRETLAKIERKLNRPNGG